LIADRDGTFNDAVNQDHEWFAGPMPARTYAVKVTDLAGASAQARFRVG
jgi:hypothetical protein